MASYHYFPRYRQAENHVTNNTLLLLQRFHQFDRFVFDELMGRLAEAGDAAYEAASGLAFTQQERGVGSVPDGALVQESVRIVIETKTSGTFRLGQLEAHLDSFKGEQHRILVMLGPKGSELGAADKASLEATAAARGIEVMDVSFEGLIAAARGCLASHHDEMQALVKDYEAFCSEMQLLPVDDYLAFVPPCGHSLALNLDLRLYFCPSSRARRRVRYFGAYAQRRIHALGLIAKIVEPIIHLGAEPTIEGAELTDDERGRIIQACVRARDENGWDITTGHRFFLCDPMVPVEMPKATPGGIRNYRYLDIRKWAGKAPGTFEEIVAKSAGASWA